MKKVFITIFSGVLLLGALYGMKVYTDSFNNSPSSKVEVNEENKINKDDDAKSEEISNENINSKEKEISQEDSDKDNNVDNKTENENNDKNNLDMEQPSDNINEQEEKSNKGDSASSTSESSNENEENKHNDKAEIKYNEQNNFTIVDLEGNEISLSDYKGKKVFLNFWATWCPPCRGEMPDMEILHNNTDDSEVVILAVNLGEDERLVRRFIDGEGFTFKVLRDIDNTVAKQYMISSIPTSYLIDENGDIVKRVVGAMNLEQMEEFIK